MTLMIQQLLNLIQFHQGFYWGQCINVGIENVFLDLQQQRVVQLDETQLHTLFHFLGGGFLYFLAGVRFLQNGQ